MAVGRRLTKEELILQLSGYGDRPTPEELRKVLSGEAKDVPRLRKDKGK